MSENRDWLHRVEAVFQAALDEPAEAREEFLRRACGDDGKLRREVDALLASYDSAGKSFLDRPAHAISDLPAPGDPLPAYVGRYRITGKLGEGGMGLVLRAVQENPARQVALKLVRPGLTGREVLRRFELETSLLARLQHPGIAQIFEAGVHRDGGGDRPYFAMELVDGPSLMQFVRTRRPELRARVAILAAVADAVHYAHQKGVVHRDLKPSNILVVEPTPAPQPLASRGSSVAAMSMPVPKVLDFGVARAMDSDIAHTTARTSVGEVLGTLPYMSPEQVLGRASGIDTRTDIYALGVIAYEVLTGEVPLKLEHLSIAAAARLICEDDPTSMGAIDRRLRGDLDTIVAKAMAKEPERRYQSASDLAADLRRWLQDEPITARPTTTLYQLRKFARRNRGLVAAIAAAFLTLIAGIVVSSSLALGQYRALRQSERHRRTAQAVNEFLNRDLLASASPTRQPDRSITLREILDRAATNIDGRFPEEPLVEAAVRTTLSDTYKGLGEYEQARVHAGKALELYRSESATPREIVQAMNKLASLERQQGNLDEAERIFRSALLIARPELGDQDETTLSLMNNLALMLEADARTAEAIELLEHVVATRTRILGEDHKNTMTSINNLALVYVAAGRYEEAEPLYLKELAYCRRTQGDEHPGTLISMNNLAVLYANRGAPEKAEPLAREVLEIRSRVLGPDHPETIEGSHTLASVLGVMRRFEEAAAVLAEALPRSTAALGPDHPITLLLLERLALVQLAAGNLQEAENAARQVYEGRRLRLGEDHALSARVLAFLASICLEQGRFEEAEAYGLQSYPVLERAFGAQDGLATDLAGVMERLYAQTGKQEERDLWAGRAAP